MHRETGPFLIQVQPIGVFLWSSQAFVCHRPVQELLPEGERAMRLRDAMAHLANGHEQVEVPIEQGSVLWEVARPVCPVCLSLAHLS